MDSTAMQYDVISMVDAMVSGDVVASMWFNATSMSSNCMSGSMCFSENSGDLVIDMRASVCFSARATSGDDVSGFDGYQCGRRCQQQCSAVMYGDDVSGTMVVNAGIHVSSDVQQ